MPLRPPLFAGSPPWPARFLSFPDNRPGLASDGAEVDNLARPKMMIPGFSAESALYRSTHRYRSFASQASGQATDPLVIAEASILTSRRHYETIPFGTLEGTSADQRVFPSITVRGGLEGPHDFDAGSPWLRPGQEICPTPYEAVPQVIPAACPAGYVQEGSIYDPFTGEWAPRCVPAGTPGWAICREGGYEVYTNLLSDPNNCGRCGNSCTGVQGGVTRCCAGACVSDITTDPSNCGGCGMACQQPQPYNGQSTGYTSCDRVPGSDGYTPTGQCVTTCYPNFTPCPGNNCYDLSSDVNNCGACGNVCSGQNPACCNGQCVDLDSSAAHCGYCGVSCLGGQMCCSGSCTDTRIDPNNCGACGHQCPAPLGSTGFCDQGGCACPAPVSGVCNSPALMGNNNYLFVDRAGGIIKDLSVSLTLTEDLQVGDSGFSVQLNTIPPPGSGMVWVQYVINAGPIPGAFGDIPDGSLWLTGNVEGWNFAGTTLCSSNADFAYGTNGCDFYPPFVNPGTSLATTSTTIPAGTVLGIDLITTGQGTSSVNFSTDFPGQQPFSQPINLPSNQQLPVAAFQVGVVGDCNSEMAIFTSGAGTIEYSASDTLCATAASPGSSPFNSCCTGENSLVMYGPASPCCGSSISQTLTAP
jgi:Stigma-specific protein, Stig1